jgi:predicted DNA-binding transcriptional regulator AlpA
MPTEGKRRIVARRDAAARLNVSERTIDRLTADASTGLHKVRISARRVGIAEDEIDNFVGRAVDQAKTA